MLGGAARTQARAPDAAGGASRAPPPPHPAHPRQTDDGNQLPSLWEILDGKKKMGRFLMGVRMFCISLGRSGRINIAII